MLLTEELEQLYARALIAIARAEGEIGGDEGARLGERVALRCGVGLEDLLLEPSLQPDELAAALRGGPFRGVAVQGDDVARMLVEDALYIALGKGHVTPEEGRRLWRYTNALGLSNDEFRQMTMQWIP